MLFVGNVSRGGTAREISHKLRTLLLMRHQMILYLGSAYIAHSTKFSAKGEIIECKGEIMNVYISGQ